MTDAGGVEAEEVVVEGDQNAILGPSPLQLMVVGEPGSACGLKVVTSNPSEG